VFEILYSVSVCLVWLLSSQKHFYNTSKVKIEFSIMFVLAFQNCFYPPKAIPDEATIRNF